MADQREELVRKMIAEGTSDDDILATLKVYDAQQPQAAAAQPSVPQKTVDPYTFAAKKILGLVKDHPVQAGAIGGGILAAPFTGGMSIPAAAAMSGLAAAGGAGYGVAAKAMKDGPSASMADDAKTVAKEGALGALGEGAGRGVMKVAQLTGRGLYRTALQPTQAALSKYGDLVGEGLENGVSVGKKGLEKATAIKGARLATKQNAITAADQNVAYLTPEIARRSVERIEPAVNAARRAGLPDATAAIQSRANQFATANPAGLKPSEAEAIKRTLDDQLGGAFRKVAKREPVTPRERYSMSLSKELGDAQAESIPGYKQMNRDVMSAEGLRQAVARRTVGSGGNQGLENALTMFGGPQAIPARIAMLPPVLSRLGMGVYQTGKVPFNDALKTALIAALGGQE